MNEQQVPASFEASNLTELDPGSQLPTFPDEEQAKQAPTFVKTVSRVFRLVLLALVLVLVALISALTSMRIAIHGREVEVPKLTGMTPLEAEAVLFDRGLRLEVENRFYAAEIPEGHILSQSPMAGSVVRRGWRVRVSESLGAPRASVPNVIGQSSRAAEINMRRRGLEVWKVAVVHLPNLPNDQVVAMSPPPDTMGSSPKVSLLLTASEESQAMLMPNLVGRRVSEVEHVVGQMGLRVGKANAKTTPSMPGKPSDLISKQFPAAGSKVSPGTVISLQVAKYR